MNVPSPVDENALSQRLAALRSARDWGEGVLSEFEHFIRSSDDYDLFRVNPIQYGRTANLSDSDAIELFVHAAKAGLFEMDWLLICAYCPQVAGSFRDLDQVHPRFLCTFCNAVNDAALDDYIQVTFTISGGVRDNAFRHPDGLSVEDFYLRYNFSKGFIAPHGMTHQQLVAVLSRGFADVEPHETRSFEFDVTAGRFELVDLNHKLLLVFFADGEPAEPQAILVRLESGRFVLPDRPTAPREIVLGDGTFSFRQTADLSPGKHTIVVENRTGDRGRFWFVQYPPGFQPHLVEYEPLLTGKRLLLTPSFATLYKSQLVDEGESLKISDLTFLFTDLKQSTPLYEAAGDVNAYFLVRQHFEILQKIIRDRSGAIVKTIGDAVMAAFERPRDAVEASIEMIEALSRFNETASRPLGLKVGVHRGRAIAVTLNERIDYFGQDVNIAARVQGLAEANEICISAAVMEEPGIADIVKSHPVSSDYEDLKGIGQKMEVHRVAIIS